MHALALASLTLLAAPSLAQEAPLPRPAPPALALALDVHEATLQTLVLPPAPGAAFALEVVLDGRAERLHVVPHEMRAEGYRLLVQDESGALIEAQPGPVTTYRGGVAGRPGSVVAAALRPLGGLSAVLRLGDELFAIEPASRFDPAAAPEDHVVFAARDARHIEATCGADELARGAAPVPTAAAAGGTGTATCEIACDADVQFYEWNGSSVAATESDITAVLNAVEAIYLVEVAIEYEVTAILVRTAEPDPYTSSEPGVLLSQLRSEWQGPQSGIHRDVAHLFTGRNMTGSTIGIAYLGSVCNGPGGYGYGVSESNYTSNSTLRTALTAHELGHNWNASHCNGAPDCAIMCSCLGCCGVTTFGAGSQASITSYAALVSCLDTGPPEPLPPVELTAILPSQVPSLVVGNEQSVSLFGSGLASVTSLRVGGQVLPPFPSQFTVVDDGWITFAMPLAAALGPLEVEAISTAGTDALTVTVVPSSPPALELGFGYPGEILTSFAPIELVLGGTPPNLVFLWVSTQLSPTLFPGLFALEIGAGGAMLPFVGVFAVEAQGWTQVELHAAGLPSGLTLHFQAVEYDPVGGTLPAESTNVASGFWLF